jgi:hypothetical protein
MLAVTILSNSHDISFMNDRVALKLYACEKHLENLRQMKLTYEVSQANKQELNHKRISLEIEIDCLILQMIGIIDCLLVQTNNKLGLGIPLHQLSIDRVMSELYSKTNKIDLLVELNEARQHGKWYWSVIELRNRSLTTSFDLNTRNPDLISFLEECFNRIKALIKDVKNKE